MRWATVTDVDARGAWVRSAWTSGVLGPLPFVGAPEPGDAVLVARLSGGDWVVIGGGYLTRAQADPLYVSRAGDSMTGRLTVTDATGTQLWLGADDGDWSGIVLGTKSGERRWLLAKTNTGALDLYRTAPGGAQERIMRVAQGSDFIGLFPDDVVQISDTRGGWVDLKVPGSNLRITAGGTELRVPYTNGPLHLNYQTQASDGASTLVTKGYVDTEVATRLTQAAADARYVNVTGDTMTGPLIVNQAGVLESMRVGNGTDSYFEVSATNNVVAQTGRTAKVVNRVGNADIRAISRGGEAYVAVDATTGRPANVEFDEQGSARWTLRYVPAFNRLEVYQNGNTGTALYFDNGTQKATFLVAIGNSSRKVKDNIRPLEHLDLIDTLQPVRYDYKEGVAGNEHDRFDRMGFIAEEVADLGIPVHNSVDGDPDSLDSDALIAVLWKEVQDLRRRVAALESA